MPSLIFVFYNADQLYSTYVGVHCNDNSLQLTLHVKMNLSSHLWLTFHC